MPALREAFADAGFEDVQTYLQSGNVVLSSGAAAKTVARKCEAVIADRFGLDIDIVVRKRAQLAAIVRRNPPGDVAGGPQAAPGRVPAPQAAPAASRQLEGI